MAVVGAQVGLRTRGLSFPCGTLHSLLSFLIAWWLDPQNEYPKKEEVNTARFLRPELRNCSNITPTLFYLS